MSGNAHPGQKTPTLKNSTIKKPRSNLALMGQYIGHSFSATVSSLIDTSGEPRTAPGVEHILTPWFLRDCPQLPHLPTQVYKNEVILNWQTGQLWGLFTQFSCNVLSTIVTDSQICVQSVGLTKHVRRHLYSQHEFRYLARFDNFSRR